MLHAKNFSSSACSMKCRSRHANCDLPVACKCQFAVYHLPDAAIHLLIAICHLLPATCHLLHDICFLPHAIYVKAVLGIKIP